MDLKKLEDKIKGTLNSVLRIAELSAQFKKPQIIWANDIIKNFDDDLNKIVVGFKSITDTLDSENTYWVLNYSDHRIISSDCLKRFRDSAANIQGSKVKLTVITSNSAFTREAVNFAIINNIGLARISPSERDENMYSVSNNFNSTSFIDLKKALCDSVFGERKNEFYGFTTKGKIDHLGSLENYFRSEIINS